METVGELNIRWQASFLAFRQRKDALEAEIVDARKSLETAPPASGGFFSKVKTALSNAATTLATNNRIKKYTAEIIALQTEFGVQVGDLFDRLVRIACDDGVNAGMKTELSVITTTAAELARIRSLLRRAITQTESAIEWQNAAGTVGGGQSPSAFSAKEHSDKARDAIRAVVQTLGKSPLGLTADGDSGLAAMQETLRAASGMAYSFNLDGGAALMNFGAADQFQTALTRLRSLDRNIRDTELHVTERWQTLTQQALANARAGNGELDALCTALKPWLSADRRQVML